MTEDQFSRNLFLSLAFHVGLLLVFSIKTLFFPSQPLVLQDSLRVDLVALPDKITPQTKAVTKPKPEPTPEKTPPSLEPKPKPRPKPSQPKVNLKKAKKQQESALQKLQALAALDRLKKEQPKAVPKEPAKKESSPPPETTYKGNVLSAGTSLTGVNKLQHNQYLSKIKEHVKNNWFLPEWLTKENLKAQVRIRINESGQLIEQSFVNASGNKEFDQRVVQTLENSNPFPAPPEKFKDILEVDGLVLGFPE